MKSPNEGGVVGFDEVKGGSQHSVNDLPLLAERFEKGDFDPVDLERLT